jgi:apolipoprotein N-acyltransferase
MVQGRADAALNPASRDLKPLLISLLAGLAHAVSMAAPWDGQPVWWLQLLALGLLAWQLGKCASPRQGAWLGWTFATAWLCGTFWWLYISMHTYGGLNAAVTVLAVFCLAAVLALFYSTVCWCFVALTLVNKAYSAIVFGALWMLAEMCRGIWFTGFGWGAAGYAHLDGLAVFAKYFGAYGVTGLAACVACQLALCVSAAMKNRPPRQQFNSLAPLALIGLLALVSNHTFSSPGAVLEVALLQGNIPQDEKFQPGTGIADALKWYGAQIQVAKASLVVAPETAIPVLPQQLPELYWETLTHRFTGAGPQSGAPGDAPPSQALLIGIPMGSYRDGYTNSVLGIKPDATATAAATPPAAYRYDKHHLVPFGEFIPPLFRWFTQMMNIPLGDFNRGAVGQASFDWQGQRLAPNICYEDLFGEELGARFRDGALAPTIFVNVSNIGWFGNTVAIDQHLAISRMRALEFERPFIRATNTGDTVIIDHLGRVTHALPRHTRGVLTGQVQGRTGTAANGFGVTPYAWWVARFWLWPLWALGVAIVLLAALASRRRQGRSL